MGGKTPRPCSEGSRKAAKKRLEGSKPAGQGHWEPVLGGDCGGFPPLQI